MSFSMSCLGNTYPVELGADGLELLCYELAVPRHGQRARGGEARDEELLVDA